MIHKRAYALAVLDGLVIDAKTNVRSDLSVSIVRNNAIVISIIR